MSKSGEPLFCLVDVCAVLEHSNPSVAIAMVDEDERAKLSLGRQGESWFITQTGIFAIALKSKSERAKPFQRWVRKEVLPSILRHGAYMTGETLEKALSSPDFLISLATNLKREQEKRIAAEKAQQVANKEVARLKPKAELMEKVLDADEKIDIGQAAKILKLPFGRNTLFQKLRDLGIFFKNRNEPKQEFIKKGYFLLKEKWIDRNEHDGFVIIKVLVTQRGLEFIAELFNKNKSQDGLVVLE